MAYPQALRQRAIRDGALLLRGLVPTDVVHQLAEVVFEQLRSMGWVDSAGAALVPTPAYDDPAFITLQQCAASSPSFDALRRCPEVMSVMATLIGDGVEAMRGDIVRFSAADGPFTPPHQDHNYLPRAGSLWTLWLPLHECPLDRGPLAVWLGSHRRGPLDHVASQGCDMSVVAPDAEWSAAHLSVGDAIAFESLMVHRSLANLSPLARVSVDFRYGSHERCPLGQLAMAAETAVRT